ncbi:MAG: hypothetical protein H6822_02485 [Planctomycetaceae bacterium]|nr:hypothetical protein [Planctomycetales bacterium]MCB9921018.1 hypothetical protein [Planctomycetaceae bacterium]
MAKPGIYRTSDSKWVHYSANKKTAKLFWYQQDEHTLREEKLNLSDSDDKQRHDEFVSDAVKYTIGEVASLGDTLPFDVTRLKRDHHRDEWCDVFLRLTELDRAGQLAIDGRRQEAAAMPSAAVVSDLIPQTRLRRFYETLRMLDAQSLGEAISDYLTNPKRAERLHVLFGESLRHFSRYENPNEPFCPPRKKHSIDAYYGKSQPFAKCLQAFLRRNMTGHQLSLPDDAAAGFSFVDYEISPFRTTGGAAFEDGKVGASGGGGVDLLLRDDGSGLPVVGEIKADTDRDLFLAFVQALTYAVELATPHQLLRLVTHYDALNCHDYGGPVVDIYIIFESGPELPRLYKQTTRLADHLMANAARPIARTIGCVRFIAADYATGRFSFSCRHTAERKDVSEIS